MGGGVDDDGVVCEREFGWVGILGGFVEDGIVYFVEVGIDSWFEVVEVLILFY